LKPRKRTGRGFKKKGEKRKEDGRGDVQKRDNDEKKPISSKWAWDSTTPYHGKKSGAEVNLSKMGGTLGWRSKIGKPEGGKLHKTSIVDSKEISSGNEFLTVLRSDKNSVGG